MCSSVLCFVSLLCFGLCSVLLFVVVVFFLLCFASGPVLDGYGRVGWQISWVGIFLSSFHHIV